MSGRNELCPIATRPPAHGSVAKEHVPGSDQRLHGALPLPEGIEPLPIQPIIETVSDILALEIRKTMDFYRATAEESEEAIQKILVAGGGSKLPGLPDFLSKRFEIPVELFDPFRQIQVDGRKFDPDYMKEIVPDMAIAVGLALRGVEAA